MGEKGLPKPKCAHWVLFVLLCATELFSSSNVLFLILIPDKSVSYIIYSFTTAPRVVLFIVSSRYICPQKWWQYYFTFDNMVVQSTTMIVVYAWMVIGGDEGSLIWRIVTVSTIPFFYFGFCGNFRTVVKHWPWTKGTILMYKFIRLYAAVGVTALQIIARKVSPGGLDLTLMLLYLSVHISFNGGCITRIPSWTAYKRSVLKKNLEYSEYSNALLNSRDEDYVSSDAQALSRSPSIGYRADTHSLQGIAIDPAI